MLSSREKRLLPLYILGGARKRREVQGAGAQLDRVRSKQSIHSAVNANNEGKCDCSGANPFLLHLSARLLVLILYANSLQSF